MLFIYSAFVYIVITCIQSWVFWQILFVCFFLEY